MTYPVPQIVTGGLNASGRRNRAQSFLRMDVDVSPLSDSGCREPYPEGNGNRITGESGQAGNGAALLGAMGASGFRDGGSAWDLVLGDERPPLALPPIYQRQLLLTILGP